MLRVDPRVEVVRAAERWRTWALEAEPLPRHRRRSSDLETGRPRSAAVAARARRRGYGRTPDPRIGQAPARPTDRRPAPPERAKNRSRGWAARTADYERQAEQLRAELQECIDKAATRPGSQPATPGTEARDSPRPRGAYTQRPRPEPQRALRGARASGPRTWAHRAVEAVTPAFPPRPAVIAKAIRRGSRRPGGHGAPRPSRRRDRGRAPARCRRNRPRDRQNEGARSPSFVTAVTVTRAVDGRAGVAAGFDCLDERLETIEHAVIPAAELRAEPARPSPGPDQVSDNPARRDPWGRDPAARTGTGGGGIPHQASLTPCRAGESMTGIGAAARRGRHELAPAGRSGRDVPPAFFPRRAPGPAGLALDFRFGLLCGAGGGAGMEPDAA